MSKPKTLNRYPLVLIAGLSGVIYLLLFTIPFPLATYYATIPPVDYTKLTNYSPTGLVAYVVGIIVLFGLYMRAIRIATPAGPGRRSLTYPIDKGGVKENAGRLIFLSSAGLAFISLFAYPLTAIDLFIYAIRTRGWALYGLNPLTTAPERLPPADPWLKLAAEWIEAASPYGPLWEWLSRSAFYLSGGDFLNQLFGLKILMALSYLGCVWLVYKNLQALQPAWILTGTIAFAWNPLVLLESVQNGHNDIVMVFFLLAAVWVFVKWTNNRRQSGKLQSTLLLSSVSALLAISILVKFVTIIIVPFFLLGIAAQAPNWPYRLGTITGSGLVIAILVAVFMAPVWPGWNNWAVLKAGEQAGRSLLALLVLGLRDRLGLNAAFDLARALLIVIFALIYLYYLLQSIQAAFNRRPLTPLPNQFWILDFGFWISLRPRPQKNDHISLAPSPPCSPAPPLPLLPSCQTLFWYVLLVAPVFHAWYLLWFLPLAVLLLPYRRPLLAGIVFSMTALLIIPYFETIRIWYPFLLRHHFFGHLIGVPLLIFPPAIAMLWPISRSERSEV